MLAIKSIIFIIIVTIGSNAGFSGYTMGGYFVKSVRKCNNPVSFINN